MHQRALDGHEKAWDPDHPSILRTVNNLRLLNASGGEHMKAKEIHLQTPNRIDEAHGTSQHP